MTNMGMNTLIFASAFATLDTRNIWTPYAELYHHESATRGPEETPGKKARAAQEVRYMHKRWGKVLKTDSAYSPNLTVEFEDFSFAWPPRQGRTSFGATRSEGAASIE